MGQKINPNILRLGVNKTWKTKFFEKKRQELPLYTFKDLEIKDYVERFLQVKGILLHDYKQNYTNSTLNLYISYFVTTSFQPKLNDLSQLVFVSKKSDKKRVNSCSVKFLSNFHSYNKAVSIDNIKTVDFYEIREYLKSNNRNQFESSSPSILIKKNNNNAKIIFEELFYVLNSFTNNKFDIIINFCCVNKDLNFLRSSQIKKFSSLQKYRNSLFLKEGFELIFHIMHNRNSANLLAMFIATQVKTIKRQKFFFSFLKQIITVFIAPKI